MDVRFCPLHRHRRAGDLLPLRPGSGHPCGHHGGHRDRAPSRASSSSPPRALETAAQGADRGAGQDRHRHHGPSPWSRTSSAPPASRRRSSSAWPPRLEEPSEHPLAHAIVEESQSPRHPPLPRVAASAPSPAAGSRPTLSGEAAAGRQCRVIWRRTVSRWQPWRPTLDRLAEDGKTPLFFAESGQSAGLRGRGRCGEARPAPTPLLLCGAWAADVVLLTGDNQRTADAIARQIGVDQVIARGAAAG